MERFAHLPLIVLVLGFCQGSPCDAQQAGVPDTAQGIYANEPEIFRPFFEGVSQPYRRFFVKPLEYPGPGRDKPEPPLDTVKIGVLAPLERTHEDYLGRNILKGVRLAIEEANASGGYRGKSFALVVRNDSGLWGASANEIAAFSYSDSVWAVIGSVDGANTHIAIRVALKTEIPIMNVGDTDPTLVETAIPWVFRVIADDRQMCYTLAHHLYEDRNFQRVAILRANNRYGRFGVAEFRYASIRLGHPAPIEVNYDTRWAEMDTTFSVQVERLRRVMPDAIVVWGDAQPAGHLVREIRAAGLEVPIFACDRLIHPEFARIAGRAAEGVVAVSPYDPSRDDPALKRFQRTYCERFDAEPDVYAAHAYDGANMVVEAIRKGGLNRYRIRDELAAMRQYHGVTGEIILDDAYTDRGPVAVATLVNGRWVFGIPRVSRLF